MSTIFHSIDVILILWWLGQAQDKSRREGIRRQK